MNSRVPVPYEHVNNMSEDIIWFCGNDGKLEGPAPTESQHDWFDVHPGRSIPEETYSWCWTTKEEVF